MPPLFRPEELSVVVLIIAPGMMKSFWGKPASPVKPCPDRGSEQSAILQGHHTLLSSRQSAGSPLRGTGTA